MSDIRFNQWLHQSGTGGVSQVASGAVGVGTTNPLADFYVRGDAQITGILTAGHIAMGSSITFGDDDRAYFGDGTDLQIYHSGSHSFIQDTGTGNLFIDSNSVQIRNAVASKTTAKFMENAQVELYYNNTERIRTTNTGAVVTGILTSTGAIDANSTLEVAGIANFDSTLQVAEKIEHLGDTDTYLQFTANTINLHSGGTTGLTVLDASVRVPTKLGINGAAPQVPLDVIANGSGYAINVRGRSSDNLGEIRFTSNDYGSLYGQIVTGPTYLNLKTGGTERLRCDADGVKTLNGRFYSAGTFAYIESSSTSNSTLTLKKSASGADSIDYLQLRDNSNALKFKISGDGILFTSDVLASHEGDTDTKIRFPSNDQISFETAGSERVRIDDDGNFLIGITGHGNASTYARNLIISGSSNRGLTIHTTDTSGSNRKACIFFGTGTSVADMADGMLFYDNASRYFHMSTAGGGTGVTQSSFRLGSDGTVRFDSTPTTVNSISLRIQSHKTRTVDDNNGIAFFDEVNHTQAAIAVQKKSTSDATSDLVFRTSSGQVVGTLQGIPERMRLTSEGYLTKPYHPAFKIAIMSQNSPNSGVVSENNGFTLKDGSTGDTFRDAFNTGDHFDQATGKFIAPVTGVYYFHFSVMRASTNGSGSMDLRIKKNTGLMLARSYRANYSTEGSFASMNVTTITSMTAGHYIEFILGTNMSVYEDDSYMMGYLIG